MKKILLSLALSSLLGAAIQDSVIPGVERLERGENLVIERYAKEQFEEMKRCFGRQDERLRIVSYNMLFNIKDSTLPVEYRWPERKQRLLEFISLAKPDLIASQELYHEQIVDLLKEIGFDYAFYGRGSADGKDAGEKNGIFYLKERLEPLAQEVLYMSLNSDRVSTGPLARDDRTLTTLHLRDQHSGKEFAILNSHFDFSAADARASHAHFIADYVEPLAEKMPVFVCGDLNTFANRPDLEQLPFYDGDYALRLLTAGSLSDAAELSILGHIGPISTFTNVEQDPRGFLGTGKPGIVLDHILVGGRATVMVHAVDPVRVNGCFPSDHMPVIVDVLLGE